MTGLVTALVIVGLLVAAALIALLPVMAGLLDWLTALRLHRQTRPLYLRIQTRRRLAADIFELTLARPRWSPWPLPRFIAGQHLVLHVPAGPGGRVERRAYSLADWQRWPRHYILAIKAEPQGLVSGWLHQHAQPGMILPVTRPKGSFHLGLAGKANQLTLVAGGIGITPMRAMVLAWVACTRPPQVTLHHCARTAGDLHYANEFMALARSQSWFHYRPRLTLPPPEWHGDHGRLTAQSLLGGPLNQPILLCAARAMEEALLTDLRAAGMTALHSEAFALDMQASGIQAIIQYRGHSLAFDGAANLLQALTRHGFDIPAECRVGECGLCRLRLCRGTAQDALTGIACQGSVLTCRTIPTSTELELG